MIVENGKVQKWNATVTTGVVEVKMMTLASKKLTMAIFRQIPERCPLVTAELKLPHKLTVVALIPNVQMWGWTQYVWTACPEWTVKHLVWAIDSTIYRYPLPSLVRTHNGIRLDHCTADRWVRNVPDNFRDDDLGLDYERKLDISSQDASHEEQMIRWLVKFNELDQLYIATG